MKQESNEAARQRELDTLRLIEVLPQEIYDDIAKLASAACGTPVALISLLDRERQWFKAHVGTDSRETTRDIAFCEHAIRQPSRMLEVKDARSDSRFADNPLVVAGPRIRFYAGMPLVTPAGHAVGTVCVWDTAPRELEPAQRAALESLARVAMHIIEAHGRETTLQRQLMLEQAIGDASVRSEASTTSTAAGDAGSEFMVLIIELQRMSNWAAIRGERLVERVMVELEASVDQIIQRHGGGHASRVSGSGEIIALMVSDDNEVTREVIEAEVAKIERAHDVQFICASAVSDVSRTRPEDVYLEADRALSKRKDALYGTWGGDTPAV